MDTDKQGEALGRQGSRGKARVRKVKVWTRLSPLYLYRVLRDSYVKGCVRFGNSSKVNAVAQSGAFHMVPDNSGFSRSSSRNQPASAQELLDLSAKFSREVLEQESVQSGRRRLSGGSVITDRHGLTLADLQGYSGPLRKIGASGLSSRELEGHSGSLRVRPSFETVPESEQYTDTDSKSSLETLFRKSSLHATDFLQSSSKSVAALADAYQLGAPPRNSDFKRSDSERPARPPHARYYSSASVAHVPMSTNLTPLAPVTDMSTFREQSNGRKSYDLPALRRGGEKSSGA